MASKLYYIDLSSPARSVLLTAKALDLQLDLIRVDLTKREQLSPEFLKVVKKNDPLLYLNNNKIQVSDLLMICVSCRLILNIQFQHSMTMDIFYGTVMPLLLI